MIPEKPYAISCDRNSEPILEVFKSLLPEKRQLLEIGSGTGQHAIFMGPSLPQLTWTLSDREENHKGIKQWIHDFPRSNIKGPLIYDVDHSSFPEGDFDVIFTANTLHILSWEQDLKLFEQVAENSKSGTLFLTYGAFNYNGKFSSESNERFEKWLKDRDPLSGIRNFEDVKAALEERDFEFSQDIQMPANNRMLSFIKK